ncbi:MAG TPA: TIGR03084 family metal-binding protein, partial [Acidimicrobiales bacterium]
TTADGWDVRDSIWHLAHYDGQAVRAVDDPAGFLVSVDELLADPDGGQAAIEATGRSIRPADLLERWRHGRAAMLARFATLDPGARIPWYGPSMGLMSFATARLMETWAHGQDVVDGLAAQGLPAHRPATDRLRHIAELGVRTRGFSYVVRGREAPPGEIRVELVAPSGASWAWGPEGATECVRGDAVDFCLLVTQRRHLADTDVVVEGDLAADWLAVAQCFAGPPTDGRPAPH